MLKSPPISPLLGIFADFWGKPGIKKQVYQILSGKLVFLF